MAAQTFIAAALCVACNLAGSFAHAQTADRQLTLGQMADSIPARNYHYTVLTLLSGAGLMFSRTNSTIQVGFPYSITDESGKVTDTTFNSGKVMPYRDPKWFLFPIAVEMGDLHNFVSAGFAFEMIGNWTNGYRASLGYGRNFFVNAPWRQHSVAAERTLMIRPGVQVSYTRDKGANGPARLGNIDNTDKTIRAFGNIAAPTYSYSDGYDYSSSTTYPARFLEMDYQTGEWAVMPRISLMSNPFLHRVGWELSLGYTIPFYDKAAILLMQDDGSGKHNTRLGHSIGLDHPGLSVNYNDRPVSKAPYHFSGFYLELSVTVCSKHDLVNTGKGGEEKASCN